MCIAKKKKKERQGKKKLSSFFNSTIWKACWKLCCNVCRSYLNTVTVLLEVVAVTIVNSRLVGNRCRDTSEK